MFTCASQGWKGQVLGGNAVNNVIYQWTILSLVRDRFGDPFCRERRCRQHCAIAMWIM